MIERLFTSDDETIEYQLVQAARGLRNVRKPSARAALEALKALPEATVQQNVCTYMRFAHPVLWRVTFHVPNGIKAASSIQAARMISQGVKAGVADLICLAPRGAYNCLALELKRLDVAPTAAQLAFLRAVSEAGGAAYWADHFERARTIIDAYARLQPTERLQC
jgi:hypothetical protein